MLSEVFVVPLQILTHEAAACVAAGPLLFIPTRNHQFMPKTTGINKGTLGSLGEGNLCCCKSNIYIIFIICVFHKPFEAYGILQSLKPRHSLAGHSALGTHQTATYVGTPGTVFSTDIQLKRDTLPSSIGLLAVFAATEPRPYPKRYSWFLAAMCASLPCGLFQQRFLFMAATP